MKFCFGSLVLILFMAGCASSTNNVVLDPVGPEPVPFHPAANTGSLTVYTAYDVHANFIGNFPGRRHYTDYKVFSSENKLLQVVHNDGGNVSPDPVTIELPAGTYRVVARANRYGLLTVPIVIAPHELTTVHLDGAGSATSRDVSSRSAVRLPDGQFVGWRTNPAGAIGTALPSSASR